MEGRTTISNLRLKFSKKTWKDTFQLVQKSLMKSRDESGPCEPLVRSLERLQEVLNVPSMTTTRSRLEMIAKQQGMGFHITEDTCYLTAALFYLEILLLPCGRVQEVKVAPHGESPVPSESFLQLLRLKNFNKFSMKLEGLYKYYSIPGDSEMQLKLLTSLQYLGKDLQQMANFSMKPMFSNTQDLINNNRIGNLIAGKEDSPLTIQFYMPVTGGLNESDPSFKEMDSESFIQAAQVTIGVSDIAHKLQMASLIPLPAQLDPEGCPVFASLNDVVYEMLPACFLLKLQPAFPVMRSFVDKLGEITDVTIPQVDLQWAPLPKILIKSLRPGSQWDTLDEQEIFTVSLPSSPMQSYILPGAVWDVPAYRAALMDSIPFSHPAHVPALLELLRHQCVINTLLRSCLTLPDANQGSNCEHHFEILMESDTSFSVTFHQPCTSSLAVLQVKIPNAHQITCCLFGERLSDLCLDEYVATVLKSSMSIPLAMKTLYNSLEEIFSAPPSPDCSTPTNDKNDHSSSLSAVAMDTNKDPSTLSQNRAMPADHGDTSG